MRKIVKLVVVLMAAVVAVAILKLHKHKRKSVDKDDNIGNGYLDVTANNIAGVWQLESYDNGSTLEEGSYSYIEFIRKDKKFVRYDNNNSMELRKRTGEFDITVNAAAIIRGMYDYSFGHDEWEHRYYVRDLTKNRMVWVAVDDESIVNVYVRAELPDFIEQEK